MCLYVFMLCIYIYIQYIDPDVFTISTGAKSPQIPQSRLHRHDLARLFVGGLEAAQFREELGWFSDPRKGQELDNMEKH